MIYELIKKYVSHFESKEFKRGEIIYHEGDQPSRMYFVDSGLVGLFHIAESGKESFLRVFSKNYVLGHRSLFAEEEYHASAVALTNTSLSYLGRDQICDLIVQHNELLREFTRILARDLRQAEIRMSGLVDKTANARIAEALIYLKLKHPEQTWTRKEIAEFSGSTLETVTRFMSVLSDEGLIEKSGRDFLIHSPDDLLNFVEP